MTTTRQMLEIVRSALAVDHGGGYDMSADGVVMIGLYEAPIMGQRFVSLYPGPSSMVQSGEVREVEYRQRIEIQAWEPVSSHSPAARIDAALALGEVITAALAGIWLDGTPPAGVWQPSMTTFVADATVLEMGHTSHGLMVVALDYMVLGDLGRV